MTGLILLVAQNPDSPLANILLANYHLDSTSGLPTNDPKFISSYKKAMQVYTQRAFKLDSKLPLTCATFGAYFLSRKAMETVEKLSRSAIALTDVNAIASDGWYLLARKAHFEDDLARAGEYYRKADEARGGGDKGFLPAKFGLAQVQVLNHDLDGAKFRLEKIVQQSKNIEAMMLLGALYAEEVFASQNGPLKEDKSAEIRKAIGLLETVRLAWKDPKKGVSPEPTVLLNLARLYETDAPEKSLACLRQVEELEIAQIPAVDRPPQVEDEASFIAALRSHLPPPLLNNIGCFLHQSGKYDEAREMFQTALGACIEVTKKDPDAQTDGPVTTISYNLARTYESAGLLDEAKKIYEGLLKRHDDYVAAHTRLAYIALRQTPTDEGPKMISKLMQSEPSDLEVRALYGWFLSKSKRRSTNISEDSEHRHHKHTLQHFDKHDRYALTGMGNIHLTNAREMRRETESEKEKRRKTYERAVEFFDKALLLDPMNAYAAQGIGIALAEDRKDYNAAVMVFNRVKETIRDASVSINLGHVHAELKNYGRAIENYEAAMAKDRGKDPQILACLGRVWLQKGKQEKSALAMKQSLVYSQQVSGL